MKSKSFLLVSAVLFVLLGTACAEDTLKFEAENGTLLGGASVQKIGDSMFVTGLQNDGDGFSLPVEVSESGFYDLFFHIKSQDGSYKENHVLADGQLVGTVSVEGKAWQDRALPYVYLEKGTHTVGMEKYWGWVQTDYVTLLPSVLLPEDLYEVEPTLCNPNASIEAQRLMTYLCDSYGNAILSGQYCDEGMYGAENASIWKTTGGKYPAILGLDMIEYSPSRVAHGSKGTSVDKAIDYWNKGGIVTFCWHWNAPEKYITGVWYSAFYTEHCNLDLAKVMDGRDPVGYDLLMKDIDAIAAELTRLRDAGVPVLWRPLHEASGGWFWWGAAGSEAYIKLYRLLYDRLTHEYGLNNLIWVWNAQSADWYPGDEYVDIIGDDIYPGERVYSSQAARFIAAMQCTNKRKIIALSENGCLPDPDLCWRDGIKWAYTGTWGSEFVLKNKVYNIISEKYTDKEMLVRFYNDERVITRDELPDLKSYPLRTD